MAALFWCWSVANLYAVLDSESLQRYGRTGYYAAELPPLMLSAPMRGIQQAVQRALPQRQYHTALCEYYKQRCGISNHKTSAVRECFLYSSNFPLLQDLKSEMELFVNCLSMLCGQRVDATPKSAIVVAEVFSEFFFKKAPLLVAIVHTA